MTGLRRLVPLLAVGGLLAVVAVAASLSAPHISTVPSTHDSPPYGRVTASIPDKPRHDYGPPAGSPP